MYSSLRKRLYLDNFWFTFCLKINTSDQVYFFNSSVLQCKHSDYKLNNTLRLGLTF